MARHRNDTISVRVEVDADEVLEDMSDKELREYCVERGIMKKAEPGAPHFDKRAEAEDFAEELWAAFCAQDRTHFRVLLTRMLPPFPPTSGLYQEKKAHP